MQRIGGYKNTVYVVYRIPEFRYGGLSTSQSIFSTSVGLF